MDKSPEVHAHKPEVGTGLGLVSVHRQMKGLPPNHQGNSDARNRFDWLLNLFLFCLLWLIRTKCLPRSQCECEAGLRSGAKGGRRGEGRKGSFSLYAAKSSPAGVRTFVSRAGTNVTVSTLKKNENKSGLLLHGRIYCQFNEQVSDFK